MANAKARQVAAKLKRKGSTTIITWGGVGDAEGMGDADATTETETVSAVMTSRSNRQGERVTYFLFPATKRSLLGARFLYGGNTYDVTKVLEYRPNDVLVFQEVDVK